MAVNYYETLLQEDLRVGIGTGTRRNPAGGTLSGTQIGIHTLAHGQAMVESNFAPGTVASLGATTHDVTYPGAGLGNFVLVGYPADLSGLIIFAQVVDDNLVRITFFNPTSAAVTVDGDNDLKVLVFKSR